MDRIAAALGVLVRTEEEEDGTAVVAAPFVLALAIECAVFFLKHDQGRLLAKRARQSS